MTTYVPLSVAEELTGRSHCWISKQCCTGMIVNAHKQRPGDGRGGVPGWVVDLDELYQIDAACSRQQSPDDPWSPIVAPAPEGDLTDVQISHLANEHWHDLEDLQPDPVITGAVRVSWSDGESYTLHPDGETGDHRFAHAGNQAHRKLPSDDELLALAESLTQREIARRYDSSSSSVSWALRRIRERSSNCERTSR